MQLVGYTLNISIIILVKKNRFFPSILSCSSLVNIIYILSNIIYFLATSLHSSLRFHAIFNCIYFSLANALSLPRTPHFSTSFITSSATFIPSPSFTHTSTPVSSLSPSTTTSNPPHTHHTGIPIPVIYNAVLFFTLLTN